MYILVSSRGPQGRLVIPTVFNSLYIKAGRGRGRRWPSGRASDSRARGPGFEPHGRRVVSLSKTL